MGNPLLQGPAGGAVPGMGADEFDALLEHIRSLSGGGAVNLSPMNDQALGHPLGVPEAPLSIGLGSGGAGLPAEITQLGQMAKPQPNPLGNRLTPVDHDPFAAEIGQAAKESIAKSAKPTLHADPTSSYVGVTLDGYNDANGKMVSYYYHPNNSPQVAVDASGKSYSPQEVAFPPKIKYGDNTPIHHVGEPTNVGPAGSAMSQDTYKTPEGGSIEFQYDKNNLPLHAVKWNAQDEQVADLAPGEVYFPPKALPKLHIGSPTYVGKEMDTYYMPQGGGEINFFYDEHGNPSSAESYHSGTDTVSQYDPDEIKFPPKAAASPKATESNSELAKSMSSSSGADPKLVQRWQDWHDLLMPDEAKSIIYYTENSGDVNSMLAGHLDPEDYPEDAAHAENISAAIKKASVNEPISLGRTIPSSIWNDTLKHLQPGGLYTHEPFASSSPDRAGPGFGGPRIVFQTPPGTPAAFVGGISQYPTENEFIMDKGLTHRVISVDPESRTIVMAPMPDERFKTWTKGNWQMPTEENLQQEYEFEYKNHLKPAVGDLFPTYESWRDAINEGQIREITPDVDRTIMGRSGTQSKEELLGLIKNYASYPEYRNEATLDNLYSRLANKQRLDMPLIYDNGSGGWRIVSGNTRMDAAQQSGIEPHAIVFRKPRTSSSPTPPDDEVPF